MDPRQQMLCDIGKEPLTHLERVESVWCRSKHLILKYQEQKQTVKAVPLRGEVVILGREPNSMGLSHHKLSSPEGLRQ